MDDAKRLDLLASVEGDIKRHEDEIVELQRIRTYLTRSPVAVTPTSPAVVTPSALSPPPVTGQGQTNPVAAPKWREVIERALRDAGRESPMRAVELAAVLVARYGVEARKGRGLERKVYTIMSRRLDRFVNLGGGQWTLAEFHPERARQQAAAANAARSASQAPDEDEDEDSEIEDTGTEKVTP